MKRYKISLMIPAHHEIVVADLQEAHREATRIALQSGTTSAGTPLAMVQSIELIGEVCTEPLDFND